MTKFRLLGPLEAGADGRLLEVGRPQLCVVLAASLANAGRLVPVDVLVERGWGVAPPDKARRTLYTHISRLRRPPAAHGRPAPLLRRSSGYQMWRGLYSRAAVIGVDLALRDSCSPPMFCHGVSLAGRPCRGPFGLSQTVWEVLERC